MPPRRRGIPLFKSADERTEFKNRRRMAKEDTIRLLRFGEYDEDGNPLTDRDVDNANILIIQSELPSRTNPTIRSYYKEIYDKLLQRRDNPNIFYTQPNTGGIPVDTRFDNLTADEYELYEETLIFDGDIVGNIADNEYDYSDGDESIEGGGNPFSRQVAPAPTATPVGVPTPRARRTDAQVVPDPFSQPEVQVVIPPTPVIADYLSTFTLDELIRRQTELEQEIQNTNEEMNQIQSNIRILQGMNVLNEDEHYYLRTFRGQRSSLESEQEARTFELSRLENEIDNRIREEVQVATPTGTGRRRRGGERTPPFPRDADDRERDLFSYDPPLVDMDEVRQQVLAEREREAKERENMAEEDWESERLRRLNSIQRHYRAGLNEILDSLLDPNLNYRNREDVINRAFLPYAYTVARHSIRDGVNYFPAVYVNEELNRALEDPRFLNFIRVRDAEQRIGQGRHRRSARPDEEYSSSEEEEEQEGGARPEGQILSEALNEAIRRIQVQLNRPIPAMGLEPPPEHIRVQAQDALQRIRNISRRMYQDLLPNNTRDDYIIGLEQQLLTDPRYINILSASDNISSDSDEPQILSGQGIQPINHKSDYHYCCGGGFIRPINAKMLPFF